MSDQERLPLGGVVPEVVGEAIAAIRDEIASSASGSETVPVHDGRPVGAAGPDRLWSFAVDGEIAPPADTPATLHVPDRDPIHATVVAVGDLGIVLGVREELGAQVPTATLSLDAAFVLAHLRGRLEALLADADHDGELVGELLFPDPGEVDDGGSLPGAEPPGDADAEQVRAARRAIEPGLRFTWGPPGTGKTRVLALAVAEAARRGQRVLVLAHANAAVDVALARIAEELTEDPELATPGVVLRAGTPQPGALDVHPNLLPATLVAAEQPETEDRRASLEGERRRLSDRLRHLDDEAERRLIADRLTTIRHELAAIDAELRRAVRELIDQAQVVGATLSRLVIDDQLWSWPSDLVAVDEASMAALPFVLALALRGGDTLSFFGDFRQLPPIARSDGEAARRWFNRDVFDYAGVIERHELGEPDRRLAVLRTQFRMGEQVCETVNQLAYAGLLRTHPSARDRAIRIAEAAPAEGDEVVIVDLSALGARCSTEAAPDRHSRCNPLSAAVSAAVAQQLAGAGLDGVGVLSPYRAQLELLSGVLGGSGSISAGTIHRFQGSEQPAIVFDLTDGFDLSGPSRLTGADPDIGLRLCNVAASRAQGKLVVVADLAFLEQRHPRGSVARQLLRCADDAGAATVDVRDLLADPSAGPEPGALRWWPSWPEALAAAAASVDPAESLEVSLPWTDLEQAWLVDLLRSRPPSSPTVVRVLPPVPAVLQRTTADLRLQPAGPTPWACFGRGLIVLGSVEPAGPAVCVRRPSLVSTVRRLMIPSP